MKLIVYRALFEKGFAPPRLLKVDVFECTEISCKRVVRKRTYCTAVRGSYIVAVRAVCSAAFVCGFDLAYKCLVISRIAFAGDVIEFNFKAGCNIEIAFVNCAVNKAAFILFNEIFGVFNVFPIDNIDCLTTEVKVFETVTNISVFIRVQLRLIRCFGFVCVV